MRAIVIEPESDVRFLLVRFLEVIGYETRGASDIEQGLSICAAFTPRVAFVDVPTSPTEFAHSAHELRACMKSRSLIVGMTVKAAPFTIDAGLDCIWKKPFDLGKARDFLQSRFPDGGTLDEVH